MSQTIEAIYEDGIFKPLNPVDLPEGTRVRVEAEESSSNSDEQLRKQLLAEGATEEECARILENFRLVWDSYETLTEQQKDLLERSRLDQNNFFNPPSHQ
jgi:predicted DNA-binding antitoxin AbrB/MazE fold protein